MTATLRAILWTCLVAQTHAFASRALTAGVSYVRDKRGRYPPKQQHPLSANARPAEESSNTSAATTKKRQQRQQNRTTDRPNRRKARPGRRRYDLLAHELLSKEEALDLARRWRRAQAIQQKLGEMMKEMRSLYEESEQRDVEGLELEGQSGDWEDDFDNQDESAEFNNLSIYGLDSISSTQKQNRDMVEMYSAVEGFENYDGAYRLPVPLTDREVMMHFGLSGGQAELERVVNDGKWARHQLIRCNLRLVASIAKKWCINYNRNNAKSRGITDDIMGRPTMDEAMQEGIVGLLQAIERFEPERNLSFTTYANFWITKYVRICFQQETTSCVRVPAQFHDARTKFRRLVKEKYAVGGDVPSLEEMAREMNLAPKRLQFMLQMTQPLVSLDGPVSGTLYTAPGKAGGVENESLIIGDTVEDDQPKPDEYVEFSFFRQDLENAMASELGAHERDIIRLRLGLDDGVIHTVNQIVEVYGGVLTPKEVRRVERLAYAKLRRPTSMATHKLATYLSFAGIDNLIR